MNCAKCGQPMDEPVLVPPGTTANICPVCELPITIEGKPLCHDCTFPDQRCGCCGRSVHAECLTPDDYWGTVCPSCKGGA